MQQMQQQQLKKGRSKWRQTDNLLLSRENNKTPQTMKRTSADLAACVVLLAKGIRKDGGNQVQEQVRPVVRDHT